MDKHRRPDPRVFIRLLTGTHPDFEWLFLHGGCYELYRMMKYLWPEAELWYQHNPGHVYIRIAGVFYDIRGAHKRKPRLAERMTPRRLGRPDKWKRRMWKLLEGYLGGDDLR